MANGRRRATRGAAPRRGEASGRGPERGGRTNGGRRAPSGRTATGRSDPRGRPLPPEPGGMHPAMIVGLIAIPILLIVAVILATSGGDEKPRPKPAPIADNGYRKEPPPPITRREPAEDLGRPLTARERSELESSWTPLRSEVSDWRKLVDEGFTAWKAENPEVMQEKFRAANDMWRSIRDRAQGLLGQFTDQQIENYLDGYETELARWGKVYQQYQKMVVPEK